MADKKISDLTAITGANTADDDLLVIVDSSSNETKKITLAEMDAAIARGDMVFGDNKKAKFGDGSDLQIYHDGSNSYIREDGVGSLRIQGADLELSNPSEIKWLKGYNNNRIELFFNNSKKLATTSTGIDVTGTVTADGLTVDGTALLKASTSTLQFRSADGASYGYNLKANINDTADYGFVIEDKDQKDLLKVSSNGDVSLFEDTGTTAKFFWDASSESLGIGTTSPSASYSIDAVKGIRSSGAAPNFTLQETDTGNQTWLMASYGGSFAIRDTTVSGTSYPFKIEAATPSNTLYLDSAGNVGIGTSSPSKTLSVAGNLQVDSGAANSDISFVADDGYDVYLGFGTTSDRYASYIRKDLGPTKQLTISAETTLSLKTNDAERMRINSTGVGIGTSSPANTLTVGDLLWSTSYADATVGIKCNANHRGIILQENSGAEQWSMGVNANGDLNFYDSSIADPIVTYQDNSGNVGLGTASPTSKLHLADTSTVITFEDTNSTNNSINTITNYEGTMILSVDPNNNSTVAESMRFSMLGSERMRIDSTAVGIGTASPSSYLSGASSLVVADSGHSGITIVSDTDSEGTICFADGTSGSDKARGVIRYSHDTESMEFHTSASEVMRINSTGVGIGTSSPDEALDVSGTVKADAIESSGVIKATDGLVQLDKSTSNVRQYAISSSSGTQSFLLGKLKTSNSADGGITGTVKAAYDYGDTLTNVNIHFTFAQRSGTERGHWWYENTDDDSSTDVVSVKLIDDGSGNYYVWLHVGDYVNCFIETVWRQVSSSDIADSGTITASTITSGTTLFDTANDPTSEHHIGKLYAHDDIYLSGGVYLGGTGAANKLDDYEEGTWTPSFNGYSTGFTGTYTKIGDIVHCRIARTTAIASGSITGSVIITGLPFTAQRAYTSPLGQIRGTTTTGASSRPYGIVHGSAVGLFTDDSFGDVAYYSASSANWDGSNFKQNSTAIYMAWEFTYRV